MTRSDKDFPPYYGHFTSGTCGSYGAMELRSYNGKMGKWENEAGVA